jgi:Domain of unknown function (DUF4124)
MLAPASHRHDLRQPGVRKSGGLRAILSTLTQRLSVTPVLLLLLPASASGDIYKWTDEQGGTVYSNSLPEHPRKAANVERVAKERVAPPAEQALLDRIDNLERRLQARAYTPPAPPAPPAPAVAPTDYYDGGYYYPPPPPPTYIGNHAPGYAAGYPYPLTPAYSYFVYPTRTFVTRPAFHGGQRGPLRSGSIHRGRR